MQAFVQKEEGALDTCSLTTSPELQLTFAPFLAATGRHFPCCDLSKGWCRWNCCGTTREICNEHGVMVYLRLLGKRLLQALLTLHKPRSIGLTSDHKYNTWGNIRYLPLLQRYRLYAVCRAGIDMCMDVHRSVHSARKIARKLPESPYTTSTRWT